MGAVYRARDLHFPNVVKRIAVKEMVNQVRDPAIRETMVKNFEREANLLATLEHPAIPRIYDYFTQDDRSYIIMEFIDGKDLEAILTESEGFLPEERVVRWAIELCDVFSYLHNHQPEPIIFRDMKPSNVMIDTRGHVMLVDFGIAKTFQIGQKGTMIGTEGYSPPEQYKGEAGPLSDIYALGATLHHLLTRRDPRLEAPFSFSERPVRSINPSVSIEIEAIINTSLQYTPTSRFPNAAVMKEALLSAARKTGMLTAVDSATNVLTNLQEGCKPLWRFETEDEVRGTPLCTQNVIYVGSYDHNLYALNAETGEFIWKYPTEGGIITKPAAYEGNIYFGSEDRCLHVVSARSGKIIWTYYTEGPVRSSPHIAEGHVFFGSDDGALHAVNTLTGRRAWKTDTASPIRSMPVLYKEMIYVGNEAGEFLCIDLGGNIKWRFKARRAITASPAIMNDTIFVGSVDAVLYALDIHSGFVIWRFRLGKGTISSPCIAEDMIFIGSADYNIYCINMNNAKEIWRFPTEHQVNASPIIYKDSVYCGSVDGNLYCLEYRTGRLRWKYSTKGAITGSPATSGDGIFFGSTDHFVHALST